MESSPMQDILLIGYGSIGAIYSFILGRSGRARVTVIARGNYEAVKAHGLNIRSAKYGHHDGWRSDRLFPTLEQALDRPYAYVVVATKLIPEVQRNSELLAPLLRPSYPHAQPTYVLLQNGLNVEADLYDALKKIAPHEEPKIISTATWIATILTDKNTVEHSDFDRVSVGLYRPTPDPVENTTADRGLLEDFASMLSAGGTDTTVVHEIQRVKFVKNIWNCVFGTAAVLTRYSLRAFFRPPPGAPSALSSGPTETLTASQRATADLPRASSEIGAFTLPFLHDAMAEVHALGAKLYPPSASGAIPGLDPDYVRQNLAAAAAAHARPDSTHRASMLVDVDLGRPMEVYHVVTEVVRMARAAGFDVPRLETMHALLLVVQNQLLRRHRGEVECD